MSSGIQMKRWYFYVSRLKQVHSKNAVSLVYTFWMSLITHGLTVSHDHTLDSHAIMIQTTWELNGYSHNGILWHITKICQNIMIVEVWPLWLYWSTEQRDIGPFLPFLMHSCILCNPLYRELQIAPHKWISQYSLRFLYLVMSSIYKTIDWERRVTMC